MPRKWTTWMKWKKFLETINLPKLNPGGENLNRPVTTNEIEAVIKKSLQTKVLDQMAS